MELNEDGTNEMGLCLGFGDRIMAQYRWASDSRKSAIGNEDEDNSARESVKSSFPGFKLLHDPHRSHKLNDTTNTTDANVIQSDQTQQKNIKKVVVKKEESLKVSAHRTPQKKRKAKQISLESTPIDPVIEQWYTDPYNRHDPEGPAGTQGRKHVLNTALRNRGFRGPRIIGIINWLVRCKGSHKDYATLVRSKKRRIERQTKGRNSILQDNQGGLMDEAASQNLQFASPTKTAKDKVPEVQDRGKQQACATAASLYPSPNSMRHFADNESPNLDDFDTNTESIPNINSTETDETGFNDVADQDSDFYSFADEVECEAIMQQLKDEITGVRPSFCSKHAPGTQKYRDDYDDWRLEDLQRTQSFWNIIYGDDLDNAIEQEQVRFTYFRDPDGMPRPDVQYPSQGLNPLKRAVLNGKEVWTEDETFGLYLPPKHERLKRKISTDVIETKTEDGLK